MTYDQLRDIRYRLSQATPGRWEFHHEKTEDYTPGAPYRQCSIVAGGGYVLGPVPDRGYCEPDTDYHDRSVRAEDAEFFAHAKADVGALLDEVMRLRRELAVLRGLTL